jgi:hypothetical protein
MSECAWLSDKMPAVARGEAQWTPDETHHMSGCPSCRQEWDLVRTASQLGGRPAAEFDVENLIPQVHLRIDGAGERRRRRAWALAALATAATLAGVLWSSRPIEPAPGPTPVATRLEIPLPELEDLQAAQLDSVLRTMDQPVEDANSSETSDSADLNTSELETVFDYWEG